MADSKSPNLSTKEIVEHLKKDPQARAELTKLLARDFPDEYLRHVRIDDTKLKNVSAQFISSDKEWQE